MTIIASIPYKGESLPVTIEDIFTGSNGKTARVRAMAGQPFCSWTHGGWAYSDTLNIRVDLLTVLAPSGIAATVELPELAGVGVES